MLSIEPILNVVANVNLIDDLISILLQSCCEDDDLVVAGHSLNKLDAARSHEEKAVILILNKKGKETVSD